MGSCSPHPCPFTRPCVSGWQQSCTTSRRLPDSQLPHEKHELDGCMQLTAPQSVRQPCPPSCSYGQASAPRPCLRATCPTAQRCRSSGTHVVTHAATFVGGQASQGAGLTEAAWAVALGISALWLGKSLMEQVFPNWLTVHPIHSLPSQAIAAREKLYVRVLQSCLLSLCVQVIHVPNDCTHCASSAGSATARGATLRHLWRHG